MTEWVDRIVEETNTHLWKSAHIQKVFKELAAGLDEGLSAFNGYMPALGKFVQQSDLRGNHLSWEAEAGRAKQPEAQIRIDVMDDRLVWHWCVGGFHASYYSGSMDFTDWGSSRAKHILSKFFARFLEIDADRSGNTPKMDIRPAPDEEEGLLNISLKAPDFGEYTGRPVSSYDLYSKLGGNFKEIAEADGYKSVNAAGETHFPFTSSSRPPAAVFTPFDVFFRALAKFEDGTQTKLSGAVSYGYE